MCDYADRGWGSSAHTRCHGAQVMKDIEFLQNLGKPLQREELDLVYVMSSLLRAR